MKKHRVTLSDDELVALRDRLVPIAPADYDLHTYSILRDLYGRFCRLTVGLDKPSVLPHNNK